MKKDERVCRGDYESAMHYDCAECFQSNCQFRKNPKIPIVLLVALVLSVLSVLAYIVF